MLIIKKDEINHFHFPYDARLEREDFTGIMIYFQKRFHTETLGILIPADETHINFKRSFEITLLPNELVLPNTSNHFDYTVFGVFGVELPLDMDLYPSLDYLVEDADIETPILHEGLAYQEGLDTNNINDIYK